MTDRQILVVDDDKLQREQMDKTVKSLNMGHVVHSDSADNAWVLLKNRPVDCVVCAYEMQEMSGLALLKIIRREEATADIPFFLADNAFTKIKVIKAGQNGVSGLVVMPCEKQVMEKKIRSVLEHIEPPVIKKSQESFEYGRKLIEDKKYDQALSVFTNLVNQKENPEYYFNIGYIRTSQGKHPEAIEAFSMATRLDRLFAKAYEEMARVYELMGNKEKTEQYMQRAAEIYMDTDKIEAAEDVLNELLEKGSESLNVFNTLGVLYRKKGEAQTALKQYQKALRVHPEEPYIHYNIGRLHLDLKDNAKAKSCFETALKIQPDFEEARQVIKAIDLGIV